MAGSKPKSTSRTTKDKVAASSFDRPEYPEALRRIERKAQVWRRAAAIGGTPPKDKDVDPELTWPSDTIGLALSGGGIRSATFSLGVLQALAETPGTLEQKDDPKKGSLLERIDFLSTVSGGGYIGSFLGRLYTRNTGELREALKRRQPKNEIRTGPHAGLVADIIRDKSSEPMWWLRESARYLAPNGAGDYIVGVAFFVRSWLAVQFVLAVFLFAVALGIVLLRFCVPFLIEWLVQNVACLSANGWIGKICGCVQSLSLVPKEQFTDSLLILSPFLGVPLTLAVIALVVNGSWFWLRTWEQTTANDKINRRHRTVQFGILMLVVVGIAVLGLIDSVGQTIYLYLRTNDWTALGAMAATAFTGAVWIVSKADQIAARIGSPAKKESSTYLPWLASAAAVAIFFVYTIALSTGAHAVAGWRIDMPNNTATSCGSGSDECSNAAATSDRKGIPFTFHYDISTVPDQCASAGSAVAPNNETGADTATQGATVTIDHGLIVRTFAVLVVFILLSIRLGWWFRFVNLTTIAPLYGARLARAYLGASNTARWYASGKPVTEPVPGDDCSTAEYRPELQGGFIHIINTTINETVSEKSNIESNDRKGLPLALTPYGMSAGVSHHALIKGRGMFEPNLDPLEGTDPRDDSNTFGLFTVEPGHDASDPCGCPIQVDNKFRIFQMLASMQPIKAMALPLSTWIAISGAAFSTGLGSRTNRAFSFLAGMFNVRMGYWWDSGVNPTFRTSDTKTPPDSISFVTNQFARAFPVQSSLCDEFLGRFHGPARRHWYLSDGGHFDNTGCYELVRRRIPIIICCDDGADSEYKFEDISNLVRLARTDFNAEITFPKPGELVGKASIPNLVDRVGEIDELRARDDENFPFPVSKAHAAVARVEYKGSKDMSYIIFLKPTVTGGENQDVLNYRRMHEDFPHESTADQFFDEAQWESYRKLGLHVGEKIFRGTNLLERLGGFPVKTKAKTKRKAKRPAPTR